MTGSINYLKGVNSGMTAAPEFSVQYQLSKLLDENMGKVTEEYKDILISSASGQREVSRILAEPRLVGKYDPSKAILKGYNPFEQFSFLEKSFSQTNYHKTHTFYFSARVGEKVFVRVNKPPKKALSLMHVVLGCGKQAPRYEQWEESDPMQNNTQKQFIDPLFGLENARQPEFCAASVIKHSCYSGEIIDHSWRYGEEFACVESRQQSKNTPSKIASAGKNLTSIVEEFTDFADPGAEEVFLNKDFKYEEYFSDDEDGYDDDCDLLVTASDLTQGCLDIFNNKSSTLLEEALEKLWITTLGPVKNKALKEHMKQRVSELKNERS